MEAFPQAAIFDSGYYRGFYTDVCVALNVMRGLR